MLRKMSAGFAATLLVVALPFAQSRPELLLEPTVAARVDKLYPGFAEIIEVCEPISLERLTVILLANPSPESLAVLLVVLEQCPHWSAPDGQGHIAVTRLWRIIRAVGELPLEPVARVLRTGNLNQRTTAAMVVSGQADLVPQRDRGALEQALIDAVFDPDMRIREAVIGRLRLIASAAGQAAIDRALSDPNVTPTFRYLATGSASPNDLLQNGRLRELRADELPALLTEPDSDVRAAAAERIAWLLGNSPNQFAVLDRDRIVTAMIASLRDPIPRIRETALEVLWRLRASRAIPALIESLNDRNISESYLRTMVHTLAALGSRDTLAVLERLTAPSQPPHIRAAAAAAYINIAKPADAAREMRRLLWEAPDTALEKDVLARGHAALPRVWDALTSGSTSERRVAAALLGSFPDPKSINPILTALAQFPGAVTRDQLLFDLNMILLDAPPARPTQRNALAATHLRWVYRQITDGAIDAKSADVILRQNMTVFPDRLVAPFSIALSSQVAASLASSPEAFRAAISKGVTGIAFHEITAAQGVARVGVTLYVQTPPGGVTTRMWIGLYREDRGDWRPMGVPAFNVVRYGMLNRPNLLPTINRDYGAHEPLKRLRLDLTMERIRVDLRDSSLLRNENVLPETSGDLDRSYVPLLERYRRSDAPSVRYTAELESTKLTGAVNVQVWLDALAQSGTPYQNMAQQVLAGYLRTQITALGRTLTGAERDNLIAAATNPQAIDPNLLPRQAPQPAEVHLVRRWDRFALIDIVMPRASGGYSMLFERRGERWVFLCLTNMWIS